MERHSTLWGTEQAGPYRRLGSSKRLGNFLTQKIGAADAKDVVELTEKLVTGVVMLPGYEHESLFSKPVAVVYAPLYLEKMAGMARGMKGFCAFAVSGLEHRPVRESSYSHTWFFAREDMLTAGEYNYLDLLMGTPVTTHQDVACHRDDSMPIVLDRLPQKVQPVLNKKDLPAVLMTIDALYQKKNVVLILEEGVGFNHRSKDLLTQIYSLMQPKLATETGFATYQSQKRILELSAETNVQIYMVPAGSDLSSLPAGKFLVLDLAKRTKPVVTSVMETLVEWGKLDWKLRVRAMESLFAKNSDYTNGDYFVKLSQEFFVQYRDLSNWLNDKSKNKSISTLEELQAEDKTETDWKLVPWAKEAFDKKYPALLSDSVELLNARNIAAFYEYKGTNESLKDRSGKAEDPVAVNRAILQYRYGSKLAGANVPELCRLIWEKADQRLGVGYREQMAGQEERYRKTLKSKEQEIAEQAKVISDQKSSFEKEWHGRERDYQQKWDERECKYQSEMTLAVEAEKKKTAEVHQKLVSSERTASARVERLAERHKAELDSLKQQQQVMMEELRNHNQTLADRLNSQNDTVEQLNNDLEEANRKITALEGELSREKESVRTLDDKLSKMKDAKENLDKDLKQAKQATESVQAEKEKLEINYKALEKQYREATGGSAPTKITKIGPIELPEKLVPVLAITGAVVFLLGILLGCLVSGVVAGSGGGADETVYNILWSANGVVGDADTKGSVTLSKTAAATGETITVTVVPADGWEIDSVKCVSGTELTKVSDTKYTFVMPAQEETIRVIFSECPVPPTDYKISWSVNGQVGSSGDMGTVVIQATKAQAGETVTAVITPADGWQLDDVQCQSGTEITRDGDTRFSFTMPECEETILITFSQILDGINWEDLKSEVPWISTVTTDAVAMEEILGKDALEAGKWVPECILLPENWTGEGTADPYILVLRRAEGQESEQPNHNDALELLQEGRLVVDNGDRCLVIQAAVSDAQNDAWNKAMCASLKICDILGEENDRLASLAYQLKGGRTIDLQEMASAADLAENWWLGLRKISCEKTDTINAESRLGTTRTVVMAITFDTGTQGMILDYKGKTNKGNEMVGLANGKGRSNSFVGDFVLVVMDGPGDVAAQ